MKPPQDKSVIAALALTFFFGPFGLFYVGKWYYALTVLAVDVLAAVSASRAFIAGALSGPPSRTSTLTLSFLAVVGIQIGSVIAAAVIASPKRGAFRA